MKPMVLRHHPLPNPFTVFLHPSRMDFLERSAAGIETSDLDEDIGQLFAAIDRAHNLCERFNTPCTPAPERRSILDELFGRDSSEVQINPPFHCDIGTNIRFGRCLRVNMDCIILDTASVEFGDYVMVGPRVQFITPEHPTDHLPRRYVSTVSKRITVGDDAWIGAGAIILPGVTIGDRAIVAAGAVVNHDVPADSVYGGVPAKRIR